MFSKKLKHTIILLIFSLFFKNFSESKINCKKNNKKINWYWPILQNTSTSKIFYPKKDNKGIEILGNKGQLILSTLSGYIVYTGNNLHGYGNLIVIKHDNNYLSTYEHTEKILIQLKQKVRAGQKIAVIGSTGTNSIKLYFNIFYKGKPINSFNFFSKR